MKRFPAEAGLFLALSLLAGRAAESKPAVPAWVETAIATPVPTYDPEVPAVVLHDEERLTLDADGRVQGTTRYAVRILTYEGREYARQRQYYETDGGKMHDVKAWLVRGPEDVIAYGKKDAIDVAVGTDLYNFNEERSCVIDRSAQADVGMVFAWESSYEERQFSGQFVHAFQLELPVLLSRFALTLPRGWSPRTVMFHHADVAPSVEGQTYTWELRDLPWIEDEPVRPALTSLAPRLAVDARAPSPGALPSFSSWPEVAAWLDQLTQPMARPSDALTAKARALAPTGMPTLDRIRAIGRYVQGLNYIAIEIGLSRGGGFRPHPAADVFTSSYGDCKDKANLVKAMLASVGIESYLVPIRADDPEYVEERWPSPMQFNHCIVAVRAEADSSFPVLRHPELGPLIFFDPTDPDTPFGDLPPDEQGSWSLLVTGHEGGLVRAPEASPLLDRRERTVEAEIDSTGAVRGTVRERSYGSEATGERRLYHQKTESEYREFLQSWMARGAPRLTVSGVRHRDDERGNRFDYEADFTAQGYAQVVGGRLLIFKPALFGRHERVILSRPKRNYPLVMSRTIYGETSGTKLPRGYTVEEIPKAVALETSFGSYEARTEFRDGSLRFTRTLRLSSKPVPADQYDAVRGFFDRVRAAETAPVVLSKR